MNELKENERVLSNEWAKGSYGTVTRLTPNGAVIEVHEPMPTSFIVPEVIRSEFWPSSDWPLLTRINTL